MADKAGKPKTGRPGTYTPELVEAVCEMMCQGKSLRSACEANGLPHPTFLRWVFEPSEFQAVVSDQYEQARAIRAELILDETIEIADASNPDRVQVDRLRCDVRDKALARMSPKRYADLKRVQHSGDMTVRTKRIVLDGE